MTPKTTIVTEGIDTLENAVTGAGMDCLDYFLLTS